MGEFVCRVADANGRVFSHVEAAADKDEARQKLADRGLYVYSVDPRNTLVSGFLGVRRERKIGGNDFLVLNQQFNTLIKAGLPILRALDLLATRASAPKLRPVLTQIRDRVREGKSLSEAVDEAGVFSKVYSTAILAGEKSGNLSGVLDYYIAYQRVSTGVKKKIGRGVGVSDLVGDHGDGHRHVPGDFCGSEIWRAVSRSGRGIADAHEDTDCGDDRLPAVHFGICCAAGADGRGSVFLVAQ